MKNFISSHKKALRWIAFGIISLVLSRILVYTPGLVETVYSRGLFLGIRIIWDYSLALLPIPLLYLAILTILGLGIRWVIHMRKGSSIKTPKQRIITSVLGFLAIGFAAIGLFFWLWGFNYNRIPLDQQLGLKKVQPQKEALIQELKLTINRLTLARNQIAPMDSNSLDITDLPPQLEKKVRNSLEGLLTEISYPTVGRVRGRKIFPKGWLIGMGATGIYIPFVSEGHFDGALHPLQHPAVIAHEMSHGYGFTNEGVCNFLALLACERSKEPMIQYAGLLMYFRYLTHDLFRMDPAYYRQLIPNLPIGIQADLSAIRENRKKYQAWFPNFSRKVYNRYLQSQGVKEGIKSYNKVVGLYASWKEKMEKKSNNNSSSNQE